MLDDAPKNVRPPVKAEEKAVVRPKPPVPIAKKPAPLVKTPTPLVKTPTPEESSKVVQFVQRLEDHAAKRHRRKRSFWIPVSLAASLIVPTLLAAVYYGFIAADRYVSEVRFALRTNEQQSADVLGLMTGMPAATVVSDSYIVVDYVDSREMVEALEERLPLRDIYSNPIADYFNRLDPSWSIEQIAKYWHRNLDVYFDHAKNTITVRVQAFDPNDSKRIVDQIVEIVRALVNDLSAQARRDAVQFAASEVARAELRVRDARNNMLVFRQDNQQFDPTASAASTLAIVGQLEAQISELNSQLSALSGYLNEDAPSIQMLKARIAALETERDRVEGEISSGEVSPLATGDAPSQGTGGTQEGGARSEGLANVLSKYQELLLDQEFAEKAYVAALGSLERARTEADRQQSYLAIYMNPSVAEDAAYPRRLLNIFLVLVLSFVGWCIGTLSFLSIRDHMR